MNRLIGLADCNNFFVSCERIFRPDLREKPVVVLSNNDGCIIARSNEAKDLGIPMGAPLFKWEQFLKHHGVTMFSGNLRLYTQISKQVMKVMGEYSDVIEQYSVDEAFFNLAIASIEDHVSYCTEMRNAVLDRVGIPVSIGISTSKTLCKLGSELAKARCRRDKSASPVCRLLAHEAYPLLSKIPLDDVWGIGRRGAARLRSSGISSITELMNADEKFIRRVLSIRGVQTVRELRGERVFPLEEGEEKQKSMMVSESFGTRLKDFEDVRVAVIKHAVEGAAQLRRRGLRASVVGVHIRTSRFIEDAYSNSAKTELSPPTSQDTEIISAAEELLRRIYVPGEEYAKAGVFFEHLEDADAQQLTLADLDPERGKNDIRMRAIDSLNARFGKKTIFPAVIKDTEGIDAHKNWKSGAVLPAQWQKSPGAPSDDSSQSTEGRRLKFGLSKYYE